MPHGIWNPQVILRFIESFPTSTNVVRVETDLGEGFMKPLGNPEGPHVLACELVGTLLADWLGLPTLETAIIHIVEGDEIPLACGRLADLGPAFISKAEQGLAWGGDSATLAKLLNRQDLSRLVVLDTWIQNCDRFRPAPNGRMNRDNVFLSRATEPTPGLILKAMDHTHAFTCGRALNRNLSGINMIQDENIFGCFPEFRPLLSAGDIASASDRLQRMDIAQAQRFVDLIPREWEVTDEVRASWIRFICERATYVARTLQARLWPEAAGNTGRV